MGCLVSENLGWGWAGGMGDKDSWPCNEKLGCWAKTEQSMYGCVQTQKGNRHIFSWIGQSELRKDFVNSNLYSHWKQKYNKNNTMVYLWKVFTDRIKSTIMYVSAASHGPWRWLEDAKEAGGQQGWLTIGPPSSRTKPRNNFCGGCRNKKLKKKRYRYVSYCLVYESCNSRFEEKCRECYKTWL